MSLPKNHKTANKRQLQDGMPNFWLQHRKEVTTMSKSVDELHNHIDAASLKDSAELFLGIFFVLAIIGVLFWSAF